MFTFGEITVTFGEIRSTLGEIRLTLGDSRRVYGFWNLFLLLVAFGNLWVGGSCRGFRKEVNLNAHAINAINLGNANLFTKCLFTTFVPLEPPPTNQQSDGFPLEFY